MELHTPGAVVDARRPAPVSERYLDRLPLPPALRAEWLAKANRRGLVEPRAQMTELHGIIAGHEVERDNPAYASIQRRLALALSVAPVVDGSVATTPPAPRQDGCEAQPKTARSPLAISAADVHGRARLVTTPSMNRTSMAPRALLSHFPLFASVKTRLMHEQRRPRSHRRQDESEAPSRGKRDAWYPAAAVRRTTLLIMVLAQTYVATSFMTAVLPYQGRQPLEIAVLILFAILFCWVSAGFWTAIMGFLLLLLGRDRHSISRSIAGDELIADAARTAIVMPICNEDVTRVFAGLGATYDSVKRTGEIRHFDFFVLSDSADPDTRVAEVNAWLELCRSVDGFGRVFYRRRQHRIKRKSGNIADFCRRWGANYRYMIVLDADSVMTGACITRLVQLAEANPSAGIIQTAPRAAGRETLYARMQQFATHLYGPLFTAGLHFWQLGESHYWGHNAIIRVAPFMRHCALGRLPGRGSLSGEILSHDFVEAALMRRAGWAVWIAYDLPGSYEEMPPNLVDELKRDRRWCQGNLMNFRLFLAEELHPAHRAVFVTGVMAYLSAPLWFLFLLLSTALLAIHTLVEPEYFSEPNQLFPSWPEWHPERAIALFTATAVLLFLPKLLSVLLIWAKHARRHGEGLRVLFSTLIELVFSALLAPIRMLFHTEFVVAALLGWRLHWKSPPRGDNETGWREAARRHGLHTLFGAAWAAGVYWLNPSFLWWLAPIVGALILSIPLSVYSSRVSLGRWARRAGFFLIPEEWRTPKELEATRQYIAVSPTPPNFIAAVIDPATNALSCASGVARRKQSGALLNERFRLVQDALLKDPDSLTAQQKTALLNDPVALSQLHFQAWTSAEANIVWQEARA
ncbi:MAG: glucans biosynthesis glucosyltransferase MdoH [Burkholderiales bacterium]|nr:glucans biosynthesis glucosyltransferase MdoH [Burkholderiales bacterium]